MAAVERRARLIMLGVVLSVAVVVGIAPLLPPEPRSDERSFSADAALADVAQIAVEPRPIGSAGSRQARDFILDRLEDLGIETETQTVEVPDYYRGTGTTTVTNVMARLPGSDSTGTVALIGHYDTVPTTSGANDNASAVAILLEAGRLLVADPQMRNDVILLFTDGEEPAPRFGSIAFVTDHPWARDAAFVINLEAIGTTGPSLLAETNGPDRWIIDQYASAVPHAAAYSWLTGITGLIGGSNTDFAPFRDAGVSGIDTAYVHESSVYHTEADAPMRVSARSIYQHGANALSLTRELGNVDFTDSKDAVDTVYFTIGRNIVVRYPAVISIPLLALAGMLLGYAVWKRHDPRSALRIAATGLVTAIVAALGITAIWIPLALWRNSMGIAESYAYLAMFVALIGFAGRIGRRIGTRGHPIGSLSGIALVWWLMALLTALVDPGIAYLFVWPALAAGLVLLPFGEAHRLSPIARYAVLAFVTLPLLVPAIDAFYQFAQPRPGNPGSQILYMVVLSGLLISLVDQLLSAVVTARTETRVTSGTT